MKPHTKLMLLVLFSLLMALLGCSKSLKLGDYEYKNLGFDTKIGLFEGEYESRPDSDAIKAKVRMEGYSSEAMVARQMVDLTRLLIQAGAGAISPVHHEMLPLIEGAEAHRLAAKVDQDNPYPPQSQGWVMWRFGYLKAKNTALFER